MEIEIKILNKEFYSYDSGLDDDSLMGADLPSYATVGSTAIDLICTEDITIRPGETKKIGTGLAIHIGSAKGKTDYAALILPRSSLGSEGLVIANTIGLIDQDYQGELIVNVYNNSEISNGFGVGLTPGYRFAQLVIIPIMKPKFKVVDEFTKETSRGVGGYGSTGE